MGGLSRGSAHWPAGDRPACGTARPPHPGIGRRALSLEAGANPAHAPASICCTRRGLRQALLRPADRRAGFGYLHVG